MQDPRTNVSPPRQLLIALDSARLRGMTPLDRRQAVTRLAMLLMEAVGAAEMEQDDDQQ